MMVCHVVEDATGQCNTAHLLRTVQQQPLNLYRQYHLQQAAALPSPLLPEFNYPNLNAGSCRISDQVGTQDFSMNISMSMNIASKPKTQRITWNMNIAHMETIAWTNKD